MHVIETTGGDSIMGMVRDQTEQALRLIDPAGAEKSVRHEAIVSNTTLATSLMPSGLEKTMSEQELLDLVAWLVSLK